MDEAPFDRGAWRRAEPKRDGSLQLWLNKALPNLDGTLDEVHTYPHRLIKFYVFFDQDQGPGITIWAQSVTHHFTWRVVDYYNIVHDSPDCIKAHKLWIISCEHEWTEPHHEQQFVTMNPDDPTHPIEVGVGPQHMSCKQCHITSENLANIMEEMVSDET